MTTNRRLVLVTGASRGIGRAIAIEFGARGCTVIINHFGDTTRAEETANEVRRRGGEAVVVEADVSQPDAVAQLDHETARYGIVDVLVNNAGICPFEDFFEITPELWDRVHGVNLKGVFLVTQAVTRRMVAAEKQGRVISISSISAFTGGAQQAHYCPTKAGVSSLMKSLAVVLGPQGITCNSVQPGVIHTDINDADLKDATKRQSIESRVPLGIGKPEDVAGLVALLAEPGASYVNGADIVCDGGLTVNVGT